MTLLRTPIFDFHKDISALTTPLMILTPNSFAGENQFKPTFCCIITVEHKLMYCSVQTLIYMNAAYTHVAAKNFLSNVQTETYWDSYQNLFEKNDLLWHEPQKDIP